VGLGAVNTRGVPVRALPPVNPFLVEMRDRMQEAAIADGASPDVIEELLGTQRVHAGEATATIDGQPWTFFFVRAQDNNWRGPFKGGIRYMDFQSDSLERSLRARLEDLEGEPADRDLEDDQAEADDAGDEEGAVERRLDLDQVTGAVGLGDRSGGPGPKEAAGPIEEAEDDGAKRGSAEPESSSGSGRGMTWAAAAAVATAPSTA
jgi:hypothetical protein